MINLKNLRVSDDVLRKQYKKYYIKLFGDSGLILNAAHLRQRLRESRLMDVTELRNWRVKKEKYPDTVYFCYEKRLVFAVNAQQNRLVTCFPFVGRKARHSNKPKTRDRRAREKEEHHRKVSPFLG